MNIFLHSSRGLSKYLADHFDGFVIVEESSDSVILDANSSTDEQWWLAELGKLCSLAESDSELTILLGLGTCLNDYSLLSSGALKGIYATGKIADETRHRFHWKTIGSLPVGHNVVMLHHCEGAVSLKESRGFSRPAIESELRQFANDEDASTLCLYGDSGVGKTVIVNASLPKGSFSYFSLGDKTGVNGAQWWKQYIGEVQNEIASPEVIASRIEQAYRGGDRRELVVLDDFQWADEFSSRLIGRICQFNIKELKLILIGRFEVRADVVKSIKVGNLTKAKLNEFIQWYCPSWGEEEVDRATETYYELTSGHIIFCRELVELDIKNGGKFVSVDAKTKNMSEVLLTRMLETYSSSTKEVLCVLAFTTGSLSSEQISWIADQINCQDYEDLEALSFITVQDSSFSLRHALFREVFTDQICSSEDAYKYNMLLAECYEEWKQPALAIPHWEMVSKDRKKSNNIELAISEAYWEVQLNQLYDLSSRYCEFIEEDCRDGKFQLELPWYVAHAHMKMGSLEVAANFANIYLMRCGFKQSKSYAWHVLFSYFYSSYTYKKVKGLSPQQLVFLSKGAYMSLEYTAFAHDNLATVSDLFRFHCLSIQAPSALDLKGLSYALVALVYFPFVGTKGILTIFNKALEAKSEGGTYVSEYIEYLSVHRKLHTDKWYSVYKRIDTLCRNTEENNHYDLLGKVSMYRIIFLLDVGRVDEARSYYDDLALRMSFFPNWLRDWIEILDHSIAIEEFRMSKIIFNKNEEINSDIVAGSNLFYATAYCYLEDLASAAQHFSVVLDKFYQMKLYHSAFTICISSLLELAIILNHHGGVSKAQLNKVFKAARVHAKLVKRSAPIVRFYEHIKKTRSIGGNICEKCKRDSEVLGAVANSKLMSAHYDTFSSKEELDLQEPVYKRTRVFWKFMKVDKPILRKS